MPRTRLIPLAALFAMLLTTSCDRAGEKDGQAEHLQEIQQARAADEAAIRAATVAWSQAAVAKDLDKSVAVYADDAVGLSPGAPIVLGKENIRKGWERMFASPGSGISFQATAVQVAQAGDLAYEYGTYDFVATDKNGKAKDAKGKFVVIWKKQPDNSWKVVVDTDNPDQ